MRYYFLALGTMLAVCVGCSVDGQDLFERDTYHAPPAAMQVRPGPMVDGPGPGVVGMMNAPQQRSFSTQTSQVRFAGPAGMKIGWQIEGGYAENQVTAPGRYNFHQASTYRLKLSDIPDRPGPPIYPTLQIYPAHPTTDAYLSHNSIPLEITDDDLDQVNSNNFVTKVVYLPDPKFQDLAIADVGILVSTQLEPGVDPVGEAERRGTILAVLRMGNMDLEVPVEAGGEAGGGDSAINPFTGEVQQSSYRQADGDAGEHVPPMAIAHDHGGLMGGVPAPMIMAGGGAPGQQAMHPVSGMGGIPAWGMPMTGTPIGLVGPPHLPYGGPAGLQQHTVRNLSSYDVGKPVDSMLIDVKHEPGIRMPDPVKYIQYTEKHPAYSPGEVSNPAWNMPHRH